jgi:regulator of sirC expression with transglutaminase-like and TPR domain
VDADSSLAPFALEVERPDDAIDLARAALVLARVEYPDLDPATHLGRLDAVAADAPDACRSGEDATRLQRLCRYLFEELGFAGNREDYYDPRNSLLNDVLERRLGIPITLSLVLIEVGRRVGLPIEGVGLPGHFIARLRSGGEHLMVDPFDAGAPLSAEACAALVARAVGQPVPLADAAFAAVSKRAFLARMLTNLKGIYWRRKDWARAAAVADRLLVLDPGAAGERRDRGLARAQQGDLRRGVADWERYLAEQPAAPDAEQVRRQVRRVRLKLAELN